VVGKEGERCVETGGAGVAFDAATSRLVAADCDEVALTSTREKGVELSWLPGTFRVWPSARVASPSIRRGAKVVIAPGGELAAVGSFDPRVTLWGMNDWSKLEPPADLMMTRAKPTYELEAGKPRATMQHPADVHRLRFSPDAKLLATLSCDDLCLWDAATGAKRAAWKGTEWYGLDFAPDGRIVLGANTDDENVQVYDREGKRVGGWSAPYRVLDLRVISPAIIATLGLDWLSLHDLETGAVHCKIKRKRYKANRWNDSAIADVRGNAIITLSPAAILRVT
jgi:WD40 repeat protein